MASDIEFFWDPVCPFAWVTSRWVEKVAIQRDLSVDWRFISLRLTNAQRDYDKEFPPGYVDGHTRGLELLRVAAAARDARGREVMGPLYAAYGAQLWMAPDGKTTELRQRGESAPIEKALADADLPVALAAAAGDETWDEVIQADTDEALARTGRNVGTPIITYGPPDGMSFFGPVISRIPDDQESLVLWDAMTTLAHFPGFSEIKRSARERIQLPALEPRD